MRDGRSCVPPPKRSIPPTFNIVFHITHPVISSTATRMERDVVFSFPRRYITTIKPPPLSSRFYLPLSCLPRDHLTSVAVSPDGIHDRPQGSKDMSTPTDWQRTIRPCNSWYRACYTRRLVMISVTDLIIQRRARVGQSEAREIHLQTNVQSKWNRESNMRTYYADVESESKRTGLHSIVRNLCG